MTGNRVEELEAKVRQLEATVTGLTDELVETKERLHALEDESDIEPDIIEGRVTRRDTRDETASRDDEQKESSAEDVTTDEADNEDNADSASDDIIVA